MRMDKPQKKKKAHTQETWIKIGHFLRALRISVLRVLGLQSKIYAIWNFISIELNDDIFLKWINFDFLKRKIR